MLGLELYGICFHLNCIGLPNYIPLPLGLQINDNLPNGVRYYFGIIQPQRSWVQITFGDHYVRGQGLLRERRIGCGTSMGCGLAELIVATTDSAYGLRSNGRRC